MVGVAGGLYFTRFVRPLLYGIDPMSRWSLALPVSCLLLVVAAWRPAHRAARIDPTVALRCD